MVFLLTLLCHFLQHGRWSGIEWKIGEGRGNPSEEGLPLSPPKTFDFIESLMPTLRVAGMGRAVALRVENDAEEAVE